MGRKSGWHRSTTNDRGQGGSARQPLPALPRSCDARMARPITTEILELRGLTGVQKLVLVAIASHGQTAFPSQRRLAMLTSLGVRTVKRAVADLRAKGILATHHDRVSLTYTVVMGGATAAPVVPERPLGGATAAPPMVPQRPPNSKGNSKENSPPIAPLKGGRRRRRQEAAADPNWTPF